MSAQNDVRSVTLHQQSGVMTVQEFAEREGLTIAQAIYRFKKGQVLGARKDARSKKWAVYPPAKLLSRPQHHLAQRGALGGSAGTAPETAGNPPSEPMRPAEEPAASRLAVDPTGSQEGHAAGGILGGGRSTHPAARSAPEALLRPSTDSASQAPQGRNEKLEGAAWFLLSEEQRGHLAFAALCQIDDLERSHEANHPEVLDAIRSLTEASRILKGGQL